MSSFTFNFIRTSVDKLIFSSSTTDKETINGQSETVKLTESKDQEKEVVQVQPEKDITGAIDLESLDYEAMEAAHSDNEVESKLEDKEAQHSQKRVESKADGESSDDSSGKGILVLSPIKGFPRNFFFPNNFFAITKPLKIIL